MKLAEYVEVWRSVGPNTPWHLVHPDDVTLTLCGAKRTGGITSGLSWVGRYDEHRCARCVRLSALQRRLAAHGRTADFRCSDCDYPIEWTDEGWAHQLGSDRALRLWCGPGNQRRVKPRPVTVPTPAD